MEWAILRTMFTEKLKYHVGLVTYNRSAIDFVLAYRDSQDGFSHVGPQVGYGKGCLKYNLMRRNKCKEGKLVFSSWLAHNCGRKIIFREILLREEKFDNEAVKLD